MTDRLIIINGWGCNNVKPNIIRIVENKARKDGKTKFEKYSFTEKGKISLRMYRRMPWAKTKTVIEITNP